VLFEKLIEQHCLYGFLAHGLWLSFLIPRDHVGIYLGHFFCNQAKRRRLSRVNLLLVAKQKQNGVYPKRLRKNIVIVHGRSHHVRGAS
jgi:hypothetical protein